MQQGKSSSPACPYCKSTLHLVGQFKICPSHGQIEDEKHSPHDKGDLARTQKIFISYGHSPPDHVVLANRIRKDLEKHGHIVWYDAEKLKAKHDWEKEIEFHIDQSETFLLLMSPYSIRRANRSDPHSTDGYCLNEIAKAVERNKRIIPVWVQWSDQGPPVSICRIQWLEMHDCVPIENKAHTYENKKFPLLLKAIEDDALDTSGEWPYIRANLRPFDFQMEMDRHISDFVGRDWLLASGGAINKWLADENNSQIFWLTGTPGVGKSAIATQLAHRHADVVAIHFCSHADEDLRDSRKAIMSIAYQLATQIPEFKLHLLSRDLSAETKGNATSMFRRLIAGPFLEAEKKSSKPLRTCVIIIDGLDEATDNQGDNELAELIAENWSRLPQQVRLFTTSRNDPAVTNPLAGLAPLFVEATDQNNVEDIRQFFSYKLNSLFKSEIDHSLVESVTRKSEGVFLYAQLLTGEIESGKRDIRRFDDLPNGLFGYYWSYFRREFPNVTHFRETVLPLLNVIIAAREPLPIMLLGLALGMGDFDIRQHLNALGTMFTVKRQCLRPIHKSVTDWLTTRSSDSDTFIAGRYAADIVAGEKALASACLQAWNGQSLFASGYGPAYLPFHLARAGMVDDLKLLVDSLCDGLREFIQKASLGGVSNDAFDCFFAQLYSEVYALGLKGEEEQVLDSWESWQSLIGLTSTKCMINRSCWHRRRGNGQKAKMLARTAASEATTTRQSLETIFEAELDVYWARPLAIYERSIELEKEYSAILLEDNALRANILHTRYFACHDLERNTEAYKLSTQSAAIFAAKGDKYKELINKVNAADALWGSRRIASAFELLDDTLSHARRLELQQVTNMGLICRANLLAAQGRLPEAEEHYRRGLELTLAISSRFSYDYLYGRLYQGLFFGANDNEAGFKILEIGKEALHSKHRHVYLLSLGYAGVYGAFSHSSFEEMREGLSDCPGAFLHGAAGWIEHGLPLGQCDPKVDVATVAKEVQGLKGLVGYVSDILKLNFDEKT